MLRIEWFRIACCVAVIAAPAAQAQAGQPPVEWNLNVDGSKTPELIPDSIAYRNLFTQLAGPPAARSRPAFLSGSGLNEADASLVFRGAERYAEAMAEADRVGRTMPAGPGQRPSPEQRLAMQQAHRNAGQVMEEVLRSFQFDLSPDGKAKLDSYVLNHIKRQTSVSSAGFGNPPPGATLQPPSARRPIPAELADRRRPDPLGGAANEAEFLALIGAASQALHIVHTAEQDTGTVLELWNASTKPIDAVRVAVCAPRLNRQSGIGTPLQESTRIAPGATAKMHIANGSRPSCDPMTPRVIAVVFADGTAAGVPAIIRQIKIETLGQVAETERISGIIEAAGDSPHILSLLEKIGPSPSGDFETVRAAYAGVLSSTDAAALDMDDPRVDSYLISGMSGPRRMLRFRLEQIAANPAGGVDSAGRNWNGIREEFRAKAAAARQYRERAGQNLYR